MVPLAYLVGLTGMFFTALKLCRHVARPFPSRDPCTRTRTADCTKSPGFFSGWLILLDYILVPSLLYLISAAALRPIFPGVPAWEWLAGFISFNAVVNLLGIEFTARVNRYMLVMELADAGSVRRVGTDCPLRRRGRRGLTLQPILRSAGIFVVRRWPAPHRLRCFRFSGF